jgi:hypothetical protein
MVGQGSSSVGKHLAYNDVDAVDWGDLVDTPLEFSIASHILSGMSSILEEKKKKMSVH